MELLCDRYHSLHLWSFKHHLLLDPKGEVENDANIDAVHLWLKYTHIFDGEDSLLALANDKYQRFRFRNVLLPVGVF